MATNHISASGIRYVSNAVAIVGGAQKLADQIGVPVQSVYFWLSGARRIPADYCPAIERETEHAVRCEDLRPDVDWGVLRSTSAAPKATQFPRPPAAAQEASHG